MQPVVHRRSQLACACCVCVCVCVRVAGGFAWAGGSPAQPLPGSPTASAHPIFILKYGTVHTARNPEADGIRNGAHPGKTNPANHSRKHRRPAQKVAGGRQTGDVAAPDD